MLDLLRRAVKSLVAQVLLGLLVVSFAVWGIGDVAAGFSTNVATVGERVVSAEAFGRTLRREQQRYGLDAAQVRASGLDQFVLATLVREAAFADAADRLGLSAPDDAVAQVVRADPGFQIGGAFDPAQYRAAVERAFGGVPAYEARVRDSLITAQIAAAAQLGAAAPQAAVARIHRRQAETRRFDAVAVTAPPQDDAPPTDAALQAHLEANAAAFQTPETRDARWLTVDPAAQAGPVGEDALREAYAAAGDAYVVAETRTVEQLVYPSRAEAEAALARLDGEEAVFETLVIERGLSPADVSLGPVAREDLTADAAEAVFGLASPGVVGPVQAPTGVALMRVTRITPEIVTPFEAVRDDLAQTLAAEAGRPEADRLAEEIEDLRAAGAPLTEIAETLGLPLTVETGMVADAAPAPDAPIAAQAARREVFAAEPGEERELVRTADGGYVLVEVTAVNAPRTPPLAEIRDAVAADLRRARRAEAALAAARTLASGLEEGGALDALAPDAAVQSIGPLRRGDPDPRLPEAARAALFAADAAVSDAVAVEGGDAARVIVLRAVIEPDDPAGRAALDAALAQSLAQDQLEFLGRALQEATEVTVNRQAIEAVLAQIGA